MTDTSIEQVVQHIRERSDGLPLRELTGVTLNFHPDTAVDGITTIEAIARDGIYRSQFETGSSNGGMTAYPGGDRWNWESRIFGGAYDQADVALRPKYGALNYRAEPVGGSPRFGSCHLRLRPHVLSRTTFCYPDSVQNPMDFGVSDRMPLIELAKANVPNLDDVLDNYIEAHVHGTLQVSTDVEAIVLDPCYRDTAVERAALTLGCILEWHDGFRLSLDHLGSCAQFRGPTVAEAISRISIDGVVTPLEIGTARDVVLDYQMAKWVWHCVARFGRIASVSDS